MDAFSFTTSYGCLRLVRALAVETHENWLEAMRYLKMEHLVEHKKEQMRQLEEAALRRPAGQPLALCERATADLSNNKQMP